MAAPVKMNEEYVRNVANAPKFSVKDKIGYMCGDLGFNSLQVIVNAYFMLFCINILGLEAAHFAIIVFVCKALDALNDTFIGRIVDNRPASKNGKMKPFLKWFALPYFAFTVVMFLNVTSMPYAAKIVWVLIMYFIWGIVGTFINVPYGAMSNIITTNQVERTELSNFRTFGSAVASIGTTTLAPLILYDANNDPIASRFILLAVILGVFCTVNLLIAHALLKERVIVTPDSNVSAAGEKVNMWQTIISFRHNRIMIAVVLAYVTAKLFTQPVSTINQYVFMVYFQDTAMLSLSSLGTMIPMFVGVILLKPLVKKIGKRNLITWPVLGAGVMYAITAFAPMTPMTWIVCQILATCCTTCNGLLLWSMIADAVDYQYYTTGKRSDGTVYATITFIVFFAASASTSIIALILDAIGYEAALGSMGQLAGVAERIKIFGGMWPAIGCLLIFICYRFIYNMTDAEMKKISDAIRTKSEESERKALSEME